VTATRQTIRRRNAPTPNTPSPGLYKILTAFYERTRTKLIVRRLSRRVRRRCYATPVGTRHEWNDADVISALISVLHSHDGTARNHAEHTRLLAERVALELGIAPEIVRTTGQATTLHDIGKICVPRRILNKPSKLDEGEWQVIRRHSEAGADIISKIGISERVSSAVLAHHERYDGRGYPAGLSGEDIPIEARIISVVDAYDAMTFDRPYGKAMKAKEALAEIERNAGTQFCPVVVRAFLGGVGRARLPCRGYTRSATGLPKSLA
jgi:putative nucleotidyltransferase with HDIG domain